MQFIQAKNFRPGRIEPIELIVVHDMEAPEARNTAENVAGWFGGPNPPMASCHYCIDIDSIVGSVKEEDTAFHAPGANANGIGLEHAGYARQTAIEWGDPYSEQMLIGSAGLAADICQRRNIPPTYLPASVLSKYKNGGIRGVTTHFDVSQAFHKSDHHDPGPNFPMQHYLALIQWKLGMWGPIPPQEENDLTPDEKRLQFAMLQDITNKVNALHEMAARANEAFFVNAGSEAGQAYWGQVAVHAK